MDNSISNPKRKDPYSVDLVRLTAPAKISKYKKCLFDFFLLMGNSWIKRNIIKLRNISAYCGIGIKQLQFQSLVLLSTTKKSSSYYDILIGDILNYIRFDLCFIKYASQNSFTYFSLIIVFTMVLMFILISIQLLTKRKIFIKVFLIIFASLIWTIENYLMIPLVIYSTVYIQHSWFLNNNYVAVYERSLEFDKLVGLGFTAQLIFLYIIVLMNTVFNYTSAYSYETAYSRAHSLVSLKQVSFLFFLSMVHIIVSKNYFLYITVSVGIGMVYNYIHYMPYYSHFDNLVDSGLWMTLTASSILSLLNEFTSGGIETVICLLIMLPVLYYLLWTKLTQNFDKRSNLKEVSPYITELKIRKICYMKKELCEESLQEIRQLFNGGTKKFIEFKLLYIWECNFEFKYSPSSTLAMMKLLKFVFAENRPNFLSKPKTIVKSFPEIEAEFFYYQLYKKINETKSIKNFSLLKYLKNYSKLNNLDSDACKRLIELIDCNLESFNYHDSKISSKCSDFFDSIHNKDSALSRYQKKYNDESDYLSRYKNFKEQLFNSNDLNTVSQSDKRRDSFIDKLMGYNSEQKIAKVIISGSPLDIGKIVYVNRNCLDLLGADSSSEVVGKDFTLLIPKPYDSYHTDILQKFLLFGQNTDLRINHLIILDVQGYSLEVSMHLSIAFYAQMPFFVLDIIGKSPKECLVFCKQSGEILSFSEELNIVIKPENKFIEEILPGISKYFENNPPGSLFLYEEYGRHELLKRLEIQIMTETFFILYLFEDESTFHFNHQLNNIPLKFSRQNSILIKTRTKDSENPKIKRTSYVKRKLRVSSAINNENFGKVIDNSNKIDKLIYYLVNANRVAFLFLGLIIMLVCVMEIKYSDNNILCDIMTDLSNIRLSSSQIALNIRSIDLLKHNEVLYYDYNTYVNITTENSLNLKNKLNGLKTYTSIYPIFQQLKEFLVLIRFYNNGNYSQESINLYQALIKVNSAVIKLKSTNFSDEESKYFIYLNCFESLFISLINSTYEMSKAMIRKNSDMLKFIQSLKSIIFIPAFFLVTLSLVFVTLLEKINKQQWKVISEIPTSTLLLVRSKTVDRMMKIHHVGDIYETIISRRFKLYLKLWPRYLLTTSLLLVITVFYYIVITYFIEEPLSLIVEMKIKQRYFGGLYRSYLIHIFIWARETYISNTSYSYNSTIKNLNPVASPNTTFHKFLNELKIVDQSIIKDTINLHNSNFDYFTYLDLLIKSSCSDNKILNCSNSPLAFGIHSIFNTITQDTNYLTQSTYSPYSELEISTEKKIYNSMIAITNANSVFENISNKYYKLYTDAFIAITAIFLFTIFAFFYFIQTKSINQLQKRLLSMNQINLMFGEGSMKKYNKTTSINNNSKLT